MDQVIYNSRTYEGETLLDIDCYIGDALASDELAVDTLTAVITDTSLETLILAADGLPVIVSNDAGPAGKLGRPWLFAADEGLPLAADSLLAAGYYGGYGMLTAAVRDNYALDKEARYGDVVRHYRGGALFGKFYLETVKRTGRYRYELHCLSAVGLLLTSTHYGGVYSGERAAEVLRDIVGGVIGYTLDASLADVPIYGWLKKATRRDNLRDFLFAIGGQVRKDSLGELNIIPMTAGTPYEIPADEFYMGGSVTGGNPATGINLTEHSYMRLPGDEVKTLFDGESAAEEITTPQGRTVTGVLVDFRNPCYDLAAQNTEILESGANYAVISGSPAAVLTGREYTHVERIITRRQDTGGTPNILASSDCTLVNLMNSELVADRLMAYYGSGKTIEADIVVTGQKPGDAVTFVDPFGDRTTGYISDMELTMSAILKAKTTLISGFIPAGSGNYYSHLAVVETSGTFTVPAGGRGKLRIVLIQGGAGGCAGGKGGDGEDGTSSGWGASGAGGEAGPGGVPGKVFIATIAASPGRSFAVTIGGGGAGAPFGGAPGEGGHTTFGPYTSADGFSPDEGYSPLLQNSIYATVGDAGVPGGAGQDAGEAGIGVNPPLTSVTYNGAAWYSGQKGADYNQSGYAGGGGLGGGPAVGANGAGGTDAGYSDLLSRGYGGIGGDGAAAAITPPNETTPGKGGTGGHGGGGGGGGGPGQGGGLAIGGGGTGGDGSPGGRGGPGVALIYY